MSPADHPRSRLGRGRVAGFPGKTVFPTKGTTCSLGGQPQPEVAGPVECLARQARLLMWA